MQDLRDNIRSNWATTGQELSRELRQFWPSSRPQSPARPPPGFLQRDNSNDGLAIPSSPLGPNPNPLSSGPRSPTAGGSVERANGNDFLTGYTLGLIGGVRSWVGGLCLRRCWDEWRLDSSDTNYPYFTDDEEPQANAGRRQPARQRRRLGRERRAGEGSATLQRRGCHEPAVGIMSAGGSLDWVRVFHDGKG